MVVSVIGVSVGSDKAVTAGPGVFVGSGRGVLVGETAVEVDESVDCWATDCGSGVGDDVEEGLQAASNNTNIVTRID